MMKRFCLLSLLAATLGLCRDAKAPKVSPLDRVIAESLATGQTPAAQTAGSLWSASGPLADLGSDLRARRLHDVITVIVSDSASAVAKGSVKSGRTTSANARIGSIAGVLPAAGALPNLLDLGSTRKLDGEGETTRETLLQTTLSARVTHVLPNGDLVVEGVKTVRINSEAQTVEVRGIVRPYDISPSNTVVSDQLSYLEVAVDGKGVINDAVHRPNFLYRLLLGILPF